jgi:hypothetical protein
MGHDMTALDHKYQRQKRLYRDLLWQHLPKGTSSTRFSVVSIPPSAPWASLEPPTAKYHADGEK